MAECFWDHDRMIGVTEDCAEGGGGGAGDITLWVSSIGGSYDAHEARFEVDTHPAVSPPADAISVSLRAAYNLDPNDYVPAEWLGGDIPDGPVSPLTPLPEVGESESLADAVWDAGEQRWTLTVTNDIITSTTNPGLFVVRVDGVDHVAWLQFGAVG